jgi:AraC-like DNA-binding protein
MNKETNITAIINSDLSISSIHYVQELKRPPNWYLEQKSERLYYGLVFIIDGSALFQFEDQSFSVQKNDIVYLPKGSQYITRAHARGVYHFMVISFQLQSDDVLKHIPLPIHMKPAQAQLCQHLFRELVKRWKRKDVVYKLKCHAILSDLLYRLIVEFLNQHFDHHSIEKIKPAVETMNRYYTHCLHIQDLARQVNLSPSHFRRLFHKIYGLSPQQYLLNLRINHAKDLLLSEMYTITEVAKRSGFANIYYFSRAFRQATGVPPSEFKNQ